MIATRTVASSAGTVCCLALAAAASVSATASPTAADVREEIGTFNIGLIGGENEADRLSRYECYGELISETLGMPVQLFPAADYAGVMQGLLAGQLHMAGLGASGYAGIHLQNPDAVTPVALQSNEDGSIGYHSVIVVPSDSPAGSVADLEGMSLAYADPNSTSGYLVPRAELAAEGIDDETFFSRTGFAGGHEQGVIAVLNGQYDAAATFSSLLGEHDEGYSRGNLRRMVDNGLLDMEDIRIVWQSNLIPNGPTVLRNDLPEEVRASLTDFLLTMHEAHPECYADTIGGEGGGFVPADHEIYADTVRMREAELAESR